MSVRDVAAGRVAVRDQKARRWDDLPWSEHPVTLRYPLRRLRCRHCGIRTERVGFADPHARLTRRFRSLLSAGVVWPWATRRRQRRLRRADPVQLVWCDLDVAARLNVLRPEHQQEEHDCSEPETHEHDVIAA